MRKKKILERPSVAQLEEELKREQYKNSYRQILRSTVNTLVTVAAAAVLVATLWLPALRIFGTSMAPTLQDGQIVFSMKTGKLEQGDIIAFYYNNKIQVKRVIAGPGDWVNFDPDGTVYVNSIRVEEPYVTEKSLGECNIMLPYQVPDGRYFVMGDHRATSVDSRHTAMGCVEEDQIVGRLVLRIWPMAEFGFVE